MPAERWPFRERLKRREEEGDRILASRLRIVRDRANKTRQQVADDAGVSYESLVGYEHAVQRAPFSTIVQLADYFGVSMDYLGGLIEDPEIQPIKKASTRRSQGRRSQGRRSQTPRSQTSRSQESRSQREGGSQENTE